MKVEVDINDNMEIEFVDVEMREHLEMTIAHFQKIANIFWPGNGEKILLKLSKTPNHIHLSRYSPKA